MIQHWPASTFTTTSFTVARNVYKFVEQDSSMLRFEPCTSFYIIANVYTHASMFLRFHCSCGVTGVTMTIISIIGSKIRSSTSVRINVLLNQR
jgi:hypothetical protein